MTLYTPSYTRVEPGEHVYFDGSESSTGEAEIKEMSGDFSARVYLERSNDSGETWEQVSQFPTAALTTSWHTKEIQPMLKTNLRRVRVENTGDSPGVVEVIGEEI